MALMQHYNAVFIAAPQTQQCNNYHLRAHCLSISGEVLISLMELFLGQCNITRDMYTAT